MTIAAEPDQPQRKPCLGPDAPLSLRMAQAAALIDEPKTRHLNTKVQPALFDAAARRAGSTSPTVVIEVAPAALATQDDVGPWLASQHGALANAGPEVMRILLKWARIGMSTTDCAFRDLAQLPGWLKVHRQERSCPTPTS